MAKDLQQKGMPLADIDSTDACGYIQLLFYGGTPEVKEAYIDDILM